MEKLNNETKAFQKNNVDVILKSNYATALKDVEFKKLVNTLKIKENVAEKYTSKLERCVSELNNCKNCKNLVECKNKVCGMVYYPKCDNDKLEFNYVACKYKKKDIEAKESIKSKFYNMPYEIKCARMKDIDGKSKERTKVIKWIIDFCDKYQEKKVNKGLFLHGTFGCGKTFLISALLNELSGKGFNSVIIYYPELLRSLKESFASDDFGLKMNEIKTSDLLLLDDIGAETVTEWNRDEILGTILQYRMDNKLPTFFTSNLTLDELNNHFVINKSSEEQIKARRIMERIKQLTEDIELIGDNRRK